MMNLEVPPARSPPTSPILPSAQPRRGTLSADSSAGSHQAGAGISDGGRSRSPTARAKKKDKETKASDSKIRKMRPKQHATSPVHKLIFDGARPSALQFPHTTDLSDFAATSDPDDAGGDEA